MCMAETMHNLHIIKSEEGNGFISGNCDLIMVSDIGRREGSFMSGVNVKGMRLIRRF